LALRKQVVGDNPLAIFFTAPGAPHLAIHGGKKLS
jgi:hypothetical protein